MLFFRLLFVLGLLSAGRLAGQTVRVEFADGSRLFGTLEPAPLTATSLAGHALEFRPADILQIVGGGAGTIRLHFRNGDRLTVKPGEAGLRLRTGFGVVPVPLDRIRELSAGVRAPVAEFDHRLHVYKGGRIELGEIPALSGAAAFTLGGWYWVDSLPGQHGLFALKLDDEHILRAHLWHNGNLYVHLRDGDPSYVAAPYAEVLRERKWFHLGVVYDGTRPPPERLTVYLDGRAMPVKPTGVIPARSPDFGRARLVLPPDSPSFTGRIRRFQVFDAVLDAAEMEVLARPGLWRGKP